MRDVAVIEEVAGIERAVAQEFVSRSVKLVRAIRGDDIDLRAGALAVFGAVGVFYDGKFAHGVNSKKLAAETAGCVVHFRCAGEFDSVEEKEIFLRAAARDGKHVADDGIRRADSAGALRGVIDDARIQRQQLVVTSTVERQIFDLALADQSGYVLGRDLERAAVRGNFHGLVNVADLKSQVDLFALPDDKGDAGATVGLEASLRCGDFVVADGQRGRVESSGFVGDERATAAGLKINYRDGGARDGGAG